MLVTASLPITARNVSASTGPSPGKVCTAIHSSTTAIGAATSPRLVQRQAVRRKRCQPEPESLSFADFAGGLLLAFEGGGEDEGRTIAGV